MFEKVQRPKRKGSKLIFKFNSEEEITTFQEIVGIGMYIYASRHRPEFRILLDSINDADTKKVFEELSKS